MQIYELSNNIKLVYEYRQGELTSFCIGFNAGAIEEENHEIGIAHAVEHMVFKGTKTRTENEINQLCDDLFCFNNAMTNYPYVIYYGTTLSSDFRRGMEIYSDILINAAFPEKGFSEEISIIKSEFRDWKSDTDQYVEDELLYNAFNTRRIKNLIIGSDKDIDSITMEKIKAFYYKYYNPGNCIISIVSSCSFEQVKKTVEELFLPWQNYKKGFSIKETYYEKNNSGLFIKNKKDIESVKIKYCFDIHELSSEKIDAMHIFNMSFGVGTSSLIYDEIRTKAGIAYEVYSEIKEERGIKLFYITLGTSRQYINKAVKIIDDTVNKAKSMDKYFSNERIEKNVRRIFMQDSIKYEKSLILSNMLTTRYLMFGKNNVYRNYDKMKDINRDFIMETVNEVLKNPAVQIVCP